MYAAKGNVIYIFFSEYIFLSCTRYAFIDFPSAEAAKEKLEENKELEIDGFSLVVDMAGNKPQKPQRSGKMPIMKNNCSLFQIFMLSSSE